MVVTGLPDLSGAVLYVAVVVIVRQALQDVIPSATAQHVSSARTIVSMIL